MVCLRSLFLSLVVFAGLWPSKALLAAGDRGFVSLHGTQTEDSWKHSSSRGKDLVTIYGLLGGYQFAQGLALGLKYFYYNANGDATQDTGIITSGWGPSVGYMHQSGVFAFASYLLEPEKEYDAGSTKVTYSEGDGIILDLGYNHDMGGSWGVGVQLTYSKITFEKQKARGQATTNLPGDWHDTSLYPHLNLFVYL